MQMAPLRYAIAVTATSAAVAFGTQQSLPHVSVSRTVRSSATLDNENAQMDGAKRNVMSQAIPFLQSSNVLVASSLAGNAGFDPMGFAQSKEDLMVFREAEIKHARLAMLAAAGWPLSELYDRQIAAALGLPATLDLQNRVPSVLNEGMGSVSPAFWGACLGLTGAIDLYGTYVARQEDPTYFPGKLGFDPLGLYPLDKVGRDRMELAEIKHGRLAMLAITGFAVQEFATKIGVVDETPVFFHPLGELF